MLLFTHKPSMSILLVYSAEFLIERGIVQLVLISLGLRENILELLEAS